MARLKHLLRALCALALALPLIGLTGAPASASPVTTFHAGFSQDCYFAYARGILDWNPPTPAAVSEVNAVGVLAHDYAACQRPPYGTTLALFTAYAAGARVDEEYVALAVGRDPLLLPFDLRLSAGEWRRPIDRVDVTVCHSTNSLSVRTVLSCGRTQTLLRPRA